MARNRSPFDAGGPDVPSCLAEPRDTAIGCTKQNQMMRSADPLQRLVPQVITVHLPTDRSGLQLAKRYIGKQFGEDGQQSHEYVTWHATRVALPDQSLSRRPVLPLPKDRPVEVGKDSALFHRAMLLDGTEVLDEGVTRLRLRAHCQHGLVEGVHQSVNLAEQKSAYTAAARACPDATARPQKPGVVFLVRCTGSSERGSNGSRDLLSLHRHPASELDHRIGCLDFPPGLGVIENGLIPPELAGDGASRLVKRAPEFIAGGVRVEWSDTDGHDFLSGFRAKRTLMSKVTARGSGPTSRLVGSTWRALGPIRITARAIGGSSTARLRSRTVVGGLTKRVTTSA